MSDTAIFEKLSDGFVHSRLQRAQAFANRGRFGEAVGLLGASGDKIPARYLPFWYGYRGSYSIPVTDNAWGPVAQDLTFSRVPVSGSEKDSLFSCLITYNRALVFLLRCQPDIKRQWLTFAQCNFATEAINNLTEVVEPLVEHGRRLTDQDQPTVLWRAGIAYSLLAEAYFAKKKTDPALEAVERSFGILGIDPHSDERVQRRQRANLGLLQAMGQPLPGHLLQPSPPGSFDWREFDPLTVCPVQ